MLVDIDKLGQKFNIWKTLEKYHQISSPERITYYLKLRDIFEKPDEIQSHNNTLMRRVAYRLANPEDPNIQAQDIIIDLNKKEKFISGVEDFVLALMKKDKSVVAQIKGKDFEDTLVDENKDTLIDENDTTLEPQLSPPDKVVDNNIDANLLNTRYQNPDIFAEDDVVWEVSAQFLENTWNDVNFVAQKIKEDKKNLKYVSDNLWDTEELFNQLIESLNINTVYSYIPPKKLSNSYIINHMKKDDENFHWAWTVAYQNLYKKEGFEEITQIINEIFFSKESIVVNFIKKTNLAYENIHESLKNNKEIAQTYIEKLTSDPIIRNISYVSPEFLKYPENHKILVKYGFSLLHYSTENKDYFTWADDKKEVLDYLDGASKHFALTFKYLSPELKEDKDIVSAYLQLNHEPQDLYQVLPESMKKDNDIVHILLDIIPKKTYNHIWKQSIFKDTLLASTSHEDIIHILETSPELIYENKEWQKNNEYLMYANDLNKILNENHEKYKDTVFLEKWFIKHQDIFNTLPDSVREKNALMLLKNMTPYTINNAFPQKFPMRLFSSKAFCLEVSKTAPQVLRCIPKEYWSNPNIVLNLLRYADESPQGKSEFIQYAPTPITKFFETFGVTKDLYPFFKSYLLKNTLDKDLNKKNKPKTMKI